MYRIFVSNLNYDAKKEDIESVVSNHCDSCEVDLPRDRKTGKGRGFAFITAPTEEKRKELMNAINNIKVAGRNISVKPFSDTRSNVRRRDEEFNEV